MYDIRVRLRMCVEFFISGLCTAVCTQTQTKRTCACGTPRRKCYYDSKIYLKLKCACVVVENKIEYVGSLFENDEIAISTWITRTDSKIRLSRFFQIIRISDNKTIFRSNVNYVCISLENFKPKKMPQLFRDSYKVTT